MKGFSLVAINAVAALCHGACSVIQYDKDNHYVKFHNPSYYTTCYIMSNNIFFTMSPACIDYACH